MLPTELEPKRRFKKTQTVNNETNARMGHALETAGKIAAAGVDFGLLKKKLEHAVEDAVLEAERIAKHGRHAVEGVVEDTTYCIKKNPWQAVDRERVCTVAR